MRLPKNPYPRSELLAVLWRMFVQAPAGPRPAPGRRRVYSDSIEVELELGFVGDIMPLMWRRARFTPGVLRFFEGVNILIGNFEGILTERWWFPFLQKHTPRILASLGEVAPLDRWVLSVANNHAGDYGAPEFHRTVGLLEYEGARVVGTVDQPRLVVAPGITLAAWTEWQNRPSPWVQAEDPEAPLTPELHIAYPHWGWEFERAPRPDARIPDGYRLVVGHHPHFPQPFQRSRDRLVAWSLGNFLTEVKLSVMGEGLLLRVGIGRVDGYYRVAFIDQLPIEIDRSDPSWSIVRPIESREGNGPLF